MNWHRPAPPNRRGPLGGRLLLFGSAYAPAVLIIGCRMLPHSYAWPAIGVGVAGLIFWAWFLLRLGRAQQREVSLSLVEPSDSEVTAYIASYLLPILAAPSPSVGDVVAYVLCGALILVVAFAADLGSINPIVYLFGFRVARAQVGGDAVIILARRYPDDGTIATVAQAAGVVLVVETKGEG
jgi:hypothetical protein